MKRKKLIWQLYPSYLLIAVFALVFVTWYASGSLRRFFLEQTSADLKARAHLIEKQILPQDLLLDRAKMDQICKENGKRSGTRITVVLPNGEVIADSEKSPEMMDNHGDRGEIRTAISGHAGMTLRYSRTLDQEMMYVAIPLKKDKQLMAVIRTALPVTSIDRELKSVQWKIGLGGLFMAILVAFISLFYSRRITKPIEVMRRGAERFAKGKLNHRLNDPPSEELSGLAEAMNQMAGQLDNRINTVINQRNELEAILSSMVEGVLAVDSNERIVSINQAALKIFEKDKKSIEYRKLQEVIRNPSLQKFISSALTDRKPLQEDITYYHHHRGERIINLHSSALLDAADQQIGTLIVLNDVTRLRRLENVRQDFVANVSHEIKTPLTAIKGFVETLMQGATENPDERERFLGIILKHVDRLNNIIGDLLTLSRIEQEKTKGSIHLKKCDLRPVILTAVQVCQIKAESRNITIEMNLDNQIEAEMDVTLLEQAIINLVDNAIKYSDEYSAVEITSQQTVLEILIKIKDYGRGIPAKHIPRLFERFYRVDKARSRQQGGTGLGLAIVKHIIQAHGGLVTVESVTGKGSTFTVSLPKVKA